MTREEAIEKLKDLYEIYENGWYNLNHDFEMNESKWKKDDFYTVLRKQSKIKDFMDALEIAIKSLENIDFFNKLYK